MRRKTASPFGKSSGKGKSAELRRSVRIRTEPAGDNRIGRVYTYIYFFPCAAESEKAMYEKNYLRRKQHLARWFSPARFGLFFHWGLFTGGGEHSSRTGAGASACLSVAGSAGGRRTRSRRRCTEYGPHGGALRRPVYHADSSAYNEACCVLYPTGVKAFRYHTHLDYAGAFLRACGKAGIRALFYLPASADHWESLAMGPDRVGGGKDAGRLPARRGGADPRTGGTLWKCHLRLLDRRDEPRNEILSRRDPPPVSGCGHHQQQ